MKIVVLDGYTLNPGDLSWDGFAALGDLTVHDRTSPPDVIARIGDAEVVITNKTPLPADVFAACPSIRYVGVLATGYNVVDVAAAKARGIPVTNIPTYGTASVAQHVFALLLEICTGVGEHAASVAAGEWGRSPDFCYWKRPLMELADKTMGIIGYGRIGQAVAKAARGFGMRVLAYDPYAEGPECVPLDVLLAQSDVISLHCPLTPENTGLINRETIAAMKDGVILLNTSRGPLVREADLAEALHSGKVYAAGVDVLETEPPRAGSPLIGAKNCFVTPHIAWAPREARARLMDIAVDNLSAFLAGKPVNVVS